MNIASRFLTVTTLAATMVLAGCDKPSDTSSGQDIKVSKDISPKGILAGEMWRQGLQAKMYVLNSAEGSVFVAENPEGITSAFIQKASLLRSDFASATPATFQPNAVLIGKMWRQGLQAKVYEVFINDKTFGIVVENPEGISADVITLNEEQPTINSPKAKPVQAAQELAGSMWRQGIQAKVYYYVPERMSGMVATIAENPEGISVKLQRAANKSISSSAIELKAVLNSDMWRNGLEAKAYEDGKTFLSENPEGISIQRKLAP